jgi:orotidine-5'-phosphate decarboxylase
MTNHIFCAIDTQDKNIAESLVGAVSPIIGGVKFGLEFYSIHGPDGIESVLEKYPDAELFLDLKFHDIPNTVAGAVHAASSRLKPSYLNVHASGGLEMMCAAKEACSASTKILAVTVLTSLDNQALAQIGYSNEASDQVRRLAGLAQEAGLDGVVCSSHEIEVLRKDCGDDFVLMVPGIRPAGAEANDQKRIMTPKEALQKGATHLVIGRPITKASDPAEAARRILQEIS